MVKIGSRSAINDRFIGMDLQKFVRTRGVENGVPAR